MFYPQNCKRNNKKTIYLKLNLVFNPTLPVWKESGWFGFQENLIIIASTIVWHASLSFLNFLSFICLVYCWVVHIVTESVPMWHRDVHKILISHLCFICTVKLSCFVFWMRSVFCCLHSLFLNYFFPSLLGMYYFFCCDIMLVIMVTNTCTQQNFYRLFSLLAIIPRWGPYWGSDVPDVNNLHPSPRFRSNLWTESKG